MIGWIIGMVVVLILFICLIFMIVHFYDAPACSMAEDEKYREALCTSANRDFKVVLRQLMEIEDGIMENTVQNVPQAGSANYDTTNEFYMAAKEIYNKCLQVEKTMREIWSNPKYTKDFYFFVGLHYTSRQLGNILSAEHRNLHQFLEACAQVQAGLQHKIGELRGKVGDIEEFEERRAMNAEIDEKTHTVSDLGSLKEKFSEIETIYFERMEKQSMETNRRADFIATHFKRLGPEWRSTMSIKPRR